MAFVKLDTGILDSTLWIERDQRELFITALLMAEPREFEEPIRQIKIGELEFTDFEAPPGWYGFVPAASFGIINRAGVDKDSGMEGLRRLGEPEVESRSKEFEGRRMIRMNGGFVILNYMKYRDKDHTAAERQRRLRARRKSEDVTRDVLDVTRDETLPERNVTQADADAKSETERRGTGKLPPSLERMVNAAHGSELPLANWLLEEAGVVADNGTRLIAATAIRLLSREGGTTKDAADYILAAAKEAVAAGEIINRFWFTDQKYRPATATKSKKQRDKDARTKAFMEAGSDD
jgi:hypothetical protein